MYPKRDLFIIDRSNPRLTRFVTHSMNTLALTEKMADELVGLCDANVFLVDAAKRLLILNMDTDDALIGYDEPHEPGIDYVIYSGDGRKVLYETWFTNASLIFLMNQITYEKLDTVSITPVGINFLSGLLTADGSTASKPNQYGAEVLIDAIYDLPSVPNPDPKDLKTDRLDKLIKKVLKKPATVVGSRERVKLSELVSKNDILPYAGRMVDMDIRGLPEDILSAVVDSHGIVIFIVRSYSQITIQDLCEFMGFYPDDIKIVHVERSA